MSSSRLSDMEWNRVKQQLEHLRVEQERAAQERGRSVLDYVAALAAFSTADNDAAATRLCDEVPKTAPPVEDELLHAVPGEEESCSGVECEESATDVIEEDPAATTTPPPMVEQSTVPLPPTEAVAVADDFSTIVSPPDKLAVAIWSHASMTKKVVAHPQPTSIATLMVSSLVRNEVVNWKFRRKLDVWGDGEPPSPFKKDSSTEEETSQGSREKRRGVAAPIEQLKMSLVAASTEGKERPKDKNGIPLVARGENAAGVPVEEEFRGDSAIH
ncbi:unnamed protein product [Linum trigynum]|uniref:Uncharacterized protein n=1 Tax=Linum trigynum TaxID=586398 RepID=A0AAV2EDC0_9ROSI